MLTAIAKSIKFDLIGVFIVIVCAYLSGYMFETLDQVTHWGGVSKFVPFGMISIGSSIMSLYSD